jgi:hypothetical protein
MSIGGHICTVCRCVSSDGRVAQVRANYSQKWSQVVVEYWVCGECHQIGDKDESALYGAFHRYVGQLIKARRVERAAGSVVHVHLS